MFYHFLAPEGGHPTCEENSIEKKNRAQGTANIYPSNKYNIFPVFLLLTNHETSHSLNIVLSFNPHFEPITVLFTITGL